MSTLVNTLTRESQCLKSEVAPAAPHSQAFRNLQHQHPSEQQDPHSFSISLDCIVLNLCSHFLISLSRHKLVHTSNSINHDGGGSNSLCGPSCSPLSRQAGLKTLTWLHIFPSSQTC